MSEKQIEFDTNSLPPQKCQQIQLTSVGAQIASRIYPGDSYDPIVLLHGGPGMRDYLAPIAQFLSPAFQVVTYDQRGGGQSSRHGPFRIEDHVNDLEILRQSIGAERIHLFGHSWGGLLAQSYARTYPQYVASLVLCSSAAGLGRDSVIEDRAFIGALLRKNPLLFPLLQILSLANFFTLGALSGLIQKVIIPYYFYHSDRVRKEDLQILSGINNSCFTGTMRSIRFTGRGNLKQVGSLLHVPVLFLRGRHDGLRGADRLLHKRFPNSQEIWFEQSGHFPWLEELDVFRTALTTFYRRIVRTF